MKWALRFLNVWLLWIVAKAEKKRLKREDVNCCQFLQHKTFWQTKAQSVERIEKIKQSIDFCNLIFSKDDSKEEYEEKYNDDDDDLDDDSLLKKKLDDDEEDPFDFSADPFEDGSEEELL